MYLDAFLILVLLLLSAFFFFRYKYGFLIPLYLYTQVTGVMSSAFVEGGVFVHEINDIVADNNATFLYMLLVVGFLVNFIIVSKLVEGPIKKIHSSRLLIKVYDGYTHENVMLFLAFSVLLVLYINMLFSPIPMFNDDVRRFTFWSEYAAFPFLSKILGELSLPVLSIFSLVLAKRLRFGLSKSRVLKLFIIFYFLYLLLLGHKFNGFIVALTTFLIPLLVYRRISGRKLFKAKELLMIAAMVLVFMSIAIFYYSRSPGGLIDIVDGNPVKAIFYRFYALQGYAWPRLYELYTNNGLLDTSYATYMDAARYELLADPEFYEANSINLANVYPGIILYQYGFFTVILFNIALSTIIAVLSVIAYYLIRTGSILRSTLAIQLLFWSVATIPNANFEVFVSLKFLVFLVALVCLTLAINFYNLTQRMPKEGEGDEC